MYGAIICMVLLGVGYRGQYGFDADVVVYAVLGPIKVPLRPH